VNLAGLPDVTHVAGAARQGCAGMLKQTERAAGSRRWFGPRTRVSQIFIGLFLIGYSAISIGPALSAALSAALGDGTRGYFVACARSSCT
jgi:hypothetical protein